MKVTTRIAIVFVVLMVLFFIQKYALDVYRNMYEHQPGVAAAAFADLGPVLTYPRAGLLYPAYLDQEQYNDNSRYKKFALHTTDSPAAVASYYASKLGPSTGSCIGLPAPCMSFKSAAPGNQVVVVDVSPITMPSSPINGQTYIGINYYPAAGANYNTFSHSSANSNGYSGSGGGHESAVVKDLLNNDQ